MTTTASSDWRLLGRAAAAIGFVVVVGGIPLAVQHFGSPDQLTRIPSTAYSSNWISIGAPIRISERIPLTIDSGIVSGIERHFDTDRRDPSSISIDLASLTLDLSKGREVGHSLATPDAPPSIAPQIAGFASGALRLTRASLTVVGPRRKSTEIQDINATLAVTRKGSYKLTGTGVANGERIAIDALWSDAAASRDDVAQVPIKLSVRGALFDASLDGLFRTDDRPSFAGDAEFKVADLRQLVKWLALGRGVSEQLRSVAVSGLLEWNAAQMSFTRANVGVNGHQATGALTIKHSGERLSMDGTLGFQELDLGRQPPALPSGAPTRGADPHILTVIDADLRLSATKVRIPGMDMGRAAVSIALNKGRLQADIAELEIESGVAGGQFAVDLNQASPRAELKAKLRGVDVGRVLSEPLRRNPILGQANLSFEGTLGGRTWSEGLASLAGRGHFELAEAGRLGLDLAALVHAAKANPAVGWSAAGKGSTSVDALTGRFRVLNGALTIESVQARSGTSILVGSGRLDVPGRLMDMIVASGTGSTGETILSAHELLVFSGTWDKPSISLRREERPALKVEAPPGIH